MFRRLSERLRTASAERPSRPLEVAAAEARIVPAGERPLAYAAASGMVRLVSPVAAEILAGLEGCRQVPPGRRPPFMVAAALEELRQAGLLHTRDELVAALRRPAASDQVPPIATVSWLTRGRPEALARSIRSFAANAAAHGRAPRLLVCDDGDGPEAGRTLEALKPLASTPLCYCGRGEKTTMVARLAAAARGSVPHDLIHFALFGLPGYGTTCGANRNAALLASVGAPLLVADDDTVCDPVRHPQPSEGISITSERDPSDLLCFADREQTLASVVRVEADYLAAHEALLGRTAGACSGAWPDDALDLGGVSPALAGLLVHGGGRVAATTGGVYGDAIVNDPGALLWLEGEARERIIASPKAFAMARASREVLRCPRQPAIGDSDLLFAASLGLDARGMIPPFLPMARGQDILFACALHICFPGALIGRPALAVLHDPVEKRTYPRDGSIHGMQAFDFVMLLQRGHEFPAWAQSPEERLRSLGAALEEAGGLAAADFAEAITPVVLGARSTQLAAALGLLQRYGRAPEHWASAVSRYMDAMEDHVAEQPLCPIDVPGSDEREMLAAFQTQIRLYGALLQAWPEIWRAATELGAAGPWAAASLA